MRHLQLGLTALCAQLLVHAKPAPVFTDAEVKDCTRIRTPELVKTSGQNWHIFATCCGANACGRKMGENLTLGDDHDDARVIMKSSSNDGRSWSKTQYLADGKKGYAGVNAIYDQITGGLVVQYQYQESGHAKRVFQVKSHDDGATWKKPADITPQLGDCLTGQTAGSRVQTGTGRLLWYGDSCVWFSDDHGDSYKAKRVQNLRNEVSFVSLANGDLYANGRGVDSDWAPNRIDYLSTNDGLQWDRSKSELKDPTSHGKGKSCERSLAYDHGHGGVMFSAEPAGTGDGERYKLVISCSTDGGKTWPHSINVNGDKKAGYSSLGVLRQLTQLLLVWEHSPHADDPIGENLLFDLVDTNWCKFKGTTNSTD